MITPEQIVRDLQRTLPVLEEEAQHAMQEAVDITHHRMQALAPKRSGELASKITALVRINSTGVTGTVRPRVKYALYIDEGSGLYAEFHHAITPKAGRGPKAALKFSDGSFRRSSKGTRPTHFIERTRTQVAQEVEDVLVNGAVKATERLFR